jgi:HSP20 family protein
LSERWWRRRRRLDREFGYFFEETDKVEKMMDDMIRRALGNEMEREKARRRYSSQFADRQVNDLKRSQINGEDEPLVDVFIDETCVVVVAELPGMGKESIEVDATENRVTISVDSSSRRYLKELALPARVDPKSSTASYKNGVLEVRLKKVADESLLIK